MISLSQYWNEIDWRDNTRNRNEKELSAYAKHNGIEEAFIVFRDSGRVRDFFDALQSIAGITQ